MNNLKFYTLFLSPDVVHVSKDPGMIPDILARDFGYHSFYVSYLSQADNKQFINSRKDLNFIEIKQKNRNTNQVFKKMMTPGVIWFIVKNARKIDVLNLYFLKYSIFYACLFKLLNPKGIIYIKLDFDVSTNKIIDSKRFNKVKEFLFGTYMRHVPTLISAESTNAVYYIKKKYKIDYPKLHYIPNGIDNKEVDGLGIKVRDFVEKENLIISVQRVGTYQKNTELLLDAIKNVDLKDWKVAIIGAIEESFKSYIDSFFNDYPHLRDNVIFTGSVADKKELYEWYNRAKIFCLTSRWESFGIVYVEAQFFGNYIISTQVVSTPDIIGNKDLGCVIKNEIELCEAFNLLIKDEAILKRSFSKRVENSTNFYWHNILKKLNVEIIKLYSLKVKR